MRRDLILSQKNDNGDYGTKVLEELLDIANKMSLEEYEEMYTMWLMKEEEK